MNDEMFRLSLIEIMNNNLLNAFVNKIFDYNLKDNEYVYIQYKIVNDNIVLNIFDNTNDNQFKAYIFTKEKIDHKENVFYINVNNCYKNYLTDSYNNIDLIGSLLISQNNMEKENIINLLFNNNIKNILLKHFVV